MAAIDRVEAGIIWSRLVSIADEMVSSLVRTSFSTMVRESGDYSCMLFDRRGKLLSQGTASVPSFTGTGPHTLGDVLKIIPTDDLRPGDVIVTNDPWIGTGHVYDINVIKPLFQREQLVGYALSVSHLADVGGLGYGTGARDVFEEGICIPPVKLMDGGVPNKFVFELIEANVRFRELVIGDIYSNIAACNVADEGFRALLNEYKIDDFVPVADAIFNLTTTAVLDALRELPEGDFSSILPVEGIADDIPLTLAVSVAITKNGFTFDFSGTSPAVGRGINVPICYTRAYCYFCFKSIVAPNIPNNQAILDFVEVRAPTNCILNAMKPFATGGRHILGHYVAPLVFGALADAIPDKIQADCGMICQVSFRGRSPAGRDFSYILFSAGGYGAFAGLDGRAALPGPSNMIGIPIEIWEENTGITFLRKEILPDSGGAGEFQGGAGQVIVLRNDTGHPVDASFFGSRTSLRARGFAGGNPGELRSMYIDERAVEPKARVEIGCGSIVRLHEAGGGGFGSAKDRRVDRISVDYRHGLITADYIQTFYSQAVDLCLRGR